MRGGGTSIRGRWAFSKVLCSRSTGSITARGWRLSIGGSRCRKPPATPLRAEYADYLLRHRGNL